MRWFLATGLMAVLLTAPIPAAPDKTKPAQDGAAEIADKLSARTDFERIDQVSFRGVIDILQEKLGYTILVDHRAILASMGEDGMNRQALEERVITVPAMKRVRLETVLRQVLEQIGADFYIESDHVKVTTTAVKDVITGPRRALPELRSSGQDEGDGPELGLLGRLTPTVTVEFKDVPVAEALKSVSMRTGRAVAINPEAADKAKALVSVALANAPFDTAVSVLAEAAGLRAYRTGNAAVIVTPERARRMDEPGPLSRVFDTESTDSRLANPDQLDRVRLDRARLDAERQALEEKVKALTAELEKLKKK